VVAGESTRDHRAYPSGAVIGQLLRGASTALCRDRRACPGGAVIDWLQPISSGKLKGYGSWYGSRCYDSRPLEYVSITTLAVSLDRYSFTFSRVNLDRFSPGSVLKSFGRLVPGAAKKIMSRPHSNM
jgi:hypothetical protein